MATSRLRFSVLDQSPVPEGSTGAQALRNTVDLAVLADWLGYHRYWLAEHHDPAMLAEARRECERTLDEARRERDRVLSEEVLANLAEHRAERILESARAREREIRLAAEDYADDILESLELNMEKFVAAVRRGRARLQVP